MRGLFAVLLVCQFVVPAVAFADEPKRPAEALPITASAAREIARLTTEGDARAAEPYAAQDPSNRRNWITRHPALFGALVGAGAGVVAGATMDNELICNGGDEDCLFYGATRFGVGAAIGAGLGALVGLIAGAAR